MKCVRHFVLLFLSLINDSHAAERRDKTKNLQTAAKKDRVGTVLRIIKG